MPIKHRVDLGTQFPRGWSCGSLEQHFWVHIYSARESQTHPVREENREDSPERLSDLLTVIQSCRGGARSSSPWFSLLSLFWPQASTLRPLIQSSSGCLDTGAPSKSLRCPVGTRPQASELAEAGIRLGTGGEDWRRFGCRGGLSSV